MGRSSLFRECMRQAGPIPEWWIRRYFGNASVPGHNNSGLRWPPKRERNTPWFRRNARRGEAWAAWALWVALRQMKLDSPRTIASSEFALRGDRGIGVVNGAVIGFSRRSSVAVPLRLGNRMNGWVTPGPTTAEEAANLGVVLASGTWTEEGALAFEEDVIDPYNAGTSSLGVILDIEVRRARGWIDADRMLGLTCLLGPLPRRAFPEGASMRKRGELDRNGMLTRLGWWRLAATASMGVGKSEFYRAKKLHSGARTWHHMRQIQLYALRRWRQDGWIPIGVEYSEFAWELRRLAHRYRPDALMVTPAGELVWFEYMRRPRARLSAVSAYKYVDLERSYLPFLALTLHRPIRFVYLGPDVNEEVVIPISHLDI
jgi:hypothetical protein